MLGATVSLPFLLCPAMCIEDNDPARGYIISTLFFVSGIVTFLQSTFGVRLPIVQGGTFSFLAPTFAILALPQNECPSDFAENGWGNYTEEEKTEEWQKRMREVQGAICVASVFQLVIGYFGIIGIMLKYITPLTVAPSVSMIGISLFASASENASLNWPVSLATIFTMILVSQYLKDVPIPVPWYQVSKPRGFKVVKAYVFRLFPVLITILVMWLVCVILTYTEFLDKSNPARADSNLDLIKKVQWFRVPYPCNLISF